MNFADLLKKNFIFIPVVASIVVGGFTSVKYVLNLTTTINASEQHIVNLDRDLKVSTDKTNDLNSRVASLEASLKMAEDLYRILSETVREHGYDIKDLNRDKNV